MKKAVYKYQLGINLSQTVVLPKGFEILSVGLQNNLPVIWCLVSPEEEKKEHIHFKFVATGEFVEMVSPIFVGTVHTREGFIFHLFREV